MNWIQLNWKRCVSLRWVILADALHQNLKIMRNRQGIWIILKSINWEIVKTEESKVKIYYTVCFKNWINKIKHNFKSLRQTPYWFITRWFHMIFWSWEVFWNYSFANNHILFFLLWLVEAVIIPMFRFFVCVGIFAGKLIQTTLSETI